MWRTWYSKGRQQCCNGFAESECVKGGERRHRFVLVQFDRTLNTLKRTILWTLSSFRICFVQLCVYDFTRVTGRSERSVRCQRRRSPVKGQTLTSSTNVFRIQIEWKICRYDQIYFGSDQFIHGKWMMGLSLARQSSKIRHRRYGIIFSN